MAIYLKPMERRRVAVDSVVDVVVGVAVGDVRHELWSDSLKTFSVFEKNLLPTFTIGSILLQSIAQRVFFKSFSLLLAQSAITYFCVHVFCPTLPPKWRGYDFFP